jgi:colanic acid/amylovoran biosynthesis glycosyltransferase
MTALRVTETDAKDQVSAWASAAPTGLEQCTVCIVQPDFGVLSETFIRAHAERLPAAVTVVHGYPPQIEGRPLATPSVIRRTVLRAWRRTVRMPLGRRITAEMTAVLSLLRPTVVLAEYGPTGVQVREACGNLGIPLVVHFHGYDASRADVLRCYQAGYAALFQDAAAIVVPSANMAARLVALGADPQKVRCNRYGVDCRLFQGQRSSRSEPCFLAVGRFVDKKAPQLTILAFANVSREVPAARLRMIGDGPLLESCRVLVERLGLQQAVRFLGAQTPAIVRQEMQRARVFVQHSVRASSGDSEGLPNTILEAGAAGLPVVATRHAGIPEIVIDNQTGILVDEHDVAGMSAAMTSLLCDPTRAERFGRSARQRIQNHFSIERSIAGLWLILQEVSATGCTRTRAASAVVI